MEFISADIKTMAYIDSETEFDRAKMKGFWEKLLGRVLGRNTCPLSFADAVAALPHRQTQNLGLRDVPVAQIVGSVGRREDFTRHFLPCSANRSGKERWRDIYTLVVTGAGFPPVELYKIGQDYFVEDGHHRISVAKHLNWQIIQAYVVEVSSPGEVLSVGNSLLNGCNEVCACIQP